MRVWISNRSFWQKLNFISGDKIQSMDMICNKHLVIVDTFLRNQPHHGQTFIEKPLYSKLFYRGPFFWAPREHFGQNLILNSGHLMTGWKNGKYMDVLFDIFFYFNYLIFPSSFHPCCNSYISIKKQFIGISSSDPTPWLTVFSVISKSTGWFVNWRNLENILLQFSGTCPTNCQGRQSIWRGGRNSNRWRWE